MSLRIERFIFFSIIAFFFIQLGKHFWPPFSFVSGIRVDYLSPTLYLTDIFIVLLFILAFINKRIYFLKKLLNPFVLSFGAVLLIGIIFSESIPASLWGLLKLFEFSFLAMYVAEHFDKKMRVPFLYLLGITAFISSVIALLQYYFQHSLGSVFYFLGERTFNTATIDIATFSLNGVSVLRPYATFPHPNVLAFFLLLSLTLLLLNLSLLKSKMFAYLFLSVIFIALLLTFSRGVIFAGILLFFLHVFTHKKLNVKTLPLVVLPVFALLVLFVFSRLSLDSLGNDWGYRENLTLIFWDIFKRFPLFGVGLLNTFIHEISYQKYVSPTLLQPVHNIYLYTLVQTGLAGFVLFLIFLKKVVVKIYTNQKSSKGSEKRWQQAVFYSLLACLFVGLFDHFLLSVQQGQLLFALILGLCFVRKA